MMVEVTLGRGDNTFRFADGRNFDVTLTDFGSTYFSALFSGAFVVPSVANSANGNGTLILDRSHKQLDISLDINGVDFGGQTAQSKDDVIGLAIHRGQQGTNGSVVWGMINPDSDSDNDTLIDAATGEVQSVWDGAEGTGGATLGSSVANLLADKLYLDIDTKEFPSGSARSQIRKADNGADHIDLTAANIGEFSTLQQLVVNFQGDAIIIARVNGHIYSLAFDGIVASQLKAGDFVFAGSAAENIAGTNEGEDLFGAGGNDTMAAGYGNDRVFGESGDDNIDGGGGKDTVTGGSGNDTLVGAAGDDLLSGIDGNDALSGLSGADRMFGGGGTDLFNGGSGHDVMAGGSESDLFSFTTSAWGGDTIADYQDGVDKLRFKRLIADNASDFTITGNHTTDVTIAIGTQALHLHGVAPITITAADFQFFA